MNDTISRQAAKEVADQVWAKTGDANAAVISQLIEELPSAQPLDVQMAYLKGMNDGIETRQYNFCPDCGAVMQEELN